MLTISYLYSLLLLFLMRGGQAAVTDVIFAVVAAIVFCVMLLIVFNGYTDRLHRDIEFSAMSQRAMVIADHLASSPGVPYNWSMSNVVLPGIVDTNRQVVFGRLANFSNFTREQVQSFFGVGVYNISFVMRYFASNITLVNQWDWNRSAAVLAATSRRVVMYGSNATYIEFTLWR